MRNAAIEVEHTPVSAEPVSALHVFGCPCEQQLTEAKTRYKHICLSDFSRLKVNPLDRIAGVINFNALSGLKLSCGNRGLPILRELAVELFPEVRIGRQVLSFLLPDKLQWMPKAQIVNDRRPLQLPHPQRISAGSGRDRK